jgi:hypothetical protein
MLSRLKFIGVIVGLAAGVIAFFVQALGLTTASVNPSLALWTLPAAMLAMLAGAGLTLVRGDVGGSLMILAGIFWLNLVQLNPVTFVPALLATLGGAIVIYVFSVEDAVPG